MVDFFKQYKDELGRDFDVDKELKEQERFPVSVVIGLSSTSGELINLNGHVGVWINPLDALKAGIEYMEGVINDPNEED